MSIETVNGYVCTNCTEAAQAKRGIDPQMSQSEQQSQQKTALAAIDDQRPRASLDYSQVLDRLA